MAVAVVEESRCLAAVGNGGSCVCVVVVVVMVVVVVVVCDDVCGVCGRGCSGPCSKNHFFTKTGTQTLNRFGK